MLPQPLLNAESYFGTQSLNIYPPLAVDWREETE